ncbi:unnamed protein product [Arctogadus glacialis]
MSSGGRGERSADCLNTDKASGAGIEERESLIVADPTTISAVLVSRLPRQPAGFLGRPQSRPPYFCLEPLPLGKVLPDAKQWRVGRVSQSLSHRGTRSGTRIRLVGDVPAPFLGSLGKPGSLVDNEPAVYTPVAGMRLCRDDGLGSPGGECLRCDRAAVTGEGGVIRPVSALAAHTVALRYLAVKLKSPSRDQISATGHPPPPVSHLHPSSLMAGRAEEPAVNSVCVERLEFRGPAAGGDG